MSSPVVPLPSNDVDARWRDFTDWVSYGVAQGWCSEPVCVTHDGLPSTDEEMAAWDEGDDPCEHGLRLWPS